MATAKKFDSPRYSLELDDKEMAALSDIVALFSVSGPGSPLDRLYGAVRSVYAGGGVPVTRVVERSGGRIAITDKEP